MGGHAQMLAESLQSADHSFVYLRPDLDWDAEAALAGLGAALSVSRDLDALVGEITAFAQPGDVVVVMSNGDFGGIHESLLGALSSKA